MLKIAVTKGRIEKEFCKMLEKSGYDVNPIINKNRKLIIKTKDELEFIFVKSSDIITYLDFGVIDIGVIGKDTLIESDNSKYQELTDLKIGKCKFCLASKPEYKNQEFNRKKVIATKYPNMTREFFNSKQEQIEIVNLNGSIEVAPVLKMTDAIVDLVETGNTLKANGLEVIEEICDISTRIITNKKALESKKEKIEDFINKLKIEM